MNFIQEYIEAFLKCYPQKKVEVNGPFSGKDRIQRWEVVIDGDKGNFRLTHEQLVEATKGFLQ